MIDEFFFSLPRSISHQSSLLTRSLITFSRFFDVFSRAVMSCRDFWFDISQIWRRSLRLET